MRRSERFACVAYRRHWMESQVCFSGIRFLFCHQSPCNLEIVFNMFQGLEGHLTTMTIKTSSLGETDTKTAAVFPRQTLYRASLHHQTAFDQKLEGASTLTF